MSRQPSACEICGHEWRKHDPEDGRCDCPASEHQDTTRPDALSHVCYCGRDLGWMRQRIAALASDALVVRTKSGTGAK